MNISETQWMKCTTYYNITIFDNQMIIPLNTKER